MDIACLLSLQSLRAATGGIFDQFFLMMSYLSVSFFSTLLPAFLFWCIDKQTGDLVLGSLSLSGTVNQCMKNTFCIYRPWIRSALIHPVPEALVDATGYSFPSGHSADAVGIYGSIAQSYRRYKWVVFFCLVIIALIGFSRNYLGVHTPQDVIVGFLDGCIALFVWNKACQWEERNPSADLWVTALGISFAVFLIVYSQLRHFPTDFVNGKLLVDPKKMVLDNYLCAGSLIGFLIARLAEHRWVHFSTETSIPVKFFRLIVGTVGLWTIVKWLIPLVVSGCGPVWGSILQRCLSSLYVVFLWPLIFSRIEKLFCTRKNQEKLASSPMPYQ